MARLRATVLGDVVDSRHHDDRQGLHDALTEVLAAVHERCPTDHPLALTVGDEFQGSYPTLGAAFEAVLATRALAAPLVDLRFGVGRGEVTVLDPGTGIQDGPGWWAAREAIDHVKARAPETGWSTLRCTYRAAEGGPDLPAAVNAALLCQDLVLGSWDSTDWSILRGLMEQRTQAEIAGDLGVSRQAVQQRRKSAGTPMLLQAAQWLAGLP
jgi:SatD family (SatD)